MSRSAGERERAIETRKPRRKRDRDSPTATACLNEAALRPLQLRSSVRRQGSQQGARRSWCTQIEFATKREKIEMHFGRAHKSPERQVAPAFPMAHSKRLHICGSRRAPHSPPIVYLCSPLQNCFAVTIMM